MGKNQDLGSGIRDKHPGSATLKKTQNLVVNSNFMKSFAIMFLKKVNMNLNVKGFVVSIIRHRGKVFDLDNFFEFFLFIQNHC
jgi:hypothetical protein